MRGQTDEQIVLLLLGVLMSEGQVGKETVGEDEWTGRWVWILRLGAGAVGSPTKVGK